jgi:hypothetical protein
MVTELLWVTTEPGSAERVGLGRVPTRKSEVGSQDIPPPIPDLISRTLQTPPASVTPAVLHPTTLIPSDEEGQLGTHSPACTWVFGFTFNPGREFLVRGLPLKPEQVLSSLETHEPLGLLKDFMDDCVLTFLPD